MSKITKTTALRRTKRLLQTEWNLEEEPLSSTSLRDDPPEGLRKNDHAIRALEGPIENSAFDDCGAKVTGGDLVGATTVGELRDVIWAGIPAANQG